MRRICYLAVLNETPEKAFAREVLIVGDNPWTNQWFKLEIKVIGECLDQPKLSLWQKIRKFL